MKVVLLKSYKDLGSQGEVIDVKKGFAVNYLIPREIAKAATREAIEKAKKKQKERKKNIAQAKDKMASFVDKYSDNTYQIQTKVSSGGRIYGSISQKEILEKLKDAFGIEKDSQIDLQIDLAKPIRQSGKYPIEVSVRAGGKKRKMDVILEIVGK
jgi:large subunit ribosomal protein L9